MAFHETAQPSTDDMIDAPRTAGALLITVPPLNLFHRELTFWRRRTNEADKAGDALERRVAQELSRSLRRVALGRVSIEMMLAGIEPLDREAAGSWYVTGTSLMAISRLWQELLDPRKSHSKLGFGFLNADICLDYDYAEPFTSGLHAKESPLRDRLGISWPAEPDTTLWYEGESVYARVSRPAHPTQSLIETYAGFYGRPFEPEAFASVVPRLKRSEWEVGDMD